MARAAVRGAQVEVWQLALEQPRHLRQDRMAVEQDGNAVLAADRRQFPFEPLMVRQPASPQTVLPLLVVRFCTWMVDRIAGEILLRKQAGRWPAGIKRRVVRRPVQVHDIARPDRLQGRDAEFVGEIVEPVEMPVGIRPHQRPLGHPRSHCCRDGGPHMGNAHQQRRVSRSKPIWREAVGVHALDHRGCRHRPRDPANATLRSL